MWPLYFLEYLLILFFLVKINTAKLIPVMLNFISSVWETLASNNAYRKDKHIYINGSLLPPKRMVQRSIIINIQYSEQLKFICGKTAGIARQLGDDNCQIYACRGKPRQKATSITL